jgi:hypothetical protein
MPADTVDAADKANKPQRPGISSGTLVTLIVFGLFYAYIVWEALGNLIQVPQLYKDNKLDSSLVPWVWLILGVIAPVVVYALAILVSRRQTVLGRCIILFVGLAVASALYLSVVELPSLI